MLFDRKHHVSLFYASSPLSLPEMTFNKDFKFILQTKFEGFCADDLSYRKQLLDMLYIDPSGVREDTPYFVFKTSLEGHTT